MNRAMLRILFSVVMLATALAFMLALLPSSDGSAQPAVAHRGTPRPLIAAAARPATATPAPTPTPTPEPVSTPGSTDGIVILSFAIVAIIVIPILLQRALWTR